MVCDDVRRLVFFYLDGTIGESKTGALRSHLESCPDCNCYVAVEQRLRQFLRVRLKPVSAPDRLRDRIRDNFRV